MKENIEWTSFNDSCRHYFKSRPLQYVQAALSCEVPILDYRVTKTNKDHL